MSKDNGKSKDLPYRLGVGAVLFNAEGQVFVAKRIDTPGDAWQMPQGGIDKDEDPRQAIWRELKEEIGTNNAEIISESPEWLTYELPKAVQKTVWKGRYRGQKQKWYALRYLGDDSDIDLTADKHPEFSTWKWADFETIPDLIIEFKRDLYQDIVATFKHLNVKD
ncbi:MAG: RNA pyrophosphohydrolase [Rhodospirillaceae bacterium]|nr:MAG: RNA pyrophosphohydrolase [Rhodospirillaceae bacterium]